MRKNNLKSKKHVLTGGPGIGKTTIIELLAALGHQVIPESARFVIEEQQAIDGNALPWKDNNAFQVKVMDRQIFLEKFIVKDVVFLDRSLVDGDGYCVHFSIPSPKGLAELLPGRYDKIFVLDPLHDYKKDSARLEDNEEMKKIHHHVTEAYVRHGYDPIFVPVLSPQERLEFILSKL